MPPAPPARRGASGMRGGGRGYDRPGDHPAVTPGVGIPPNRPEEETHPAESRGRGRRQRWSPGQVGCAPPSPGQGAHDPRCRRRRRGVEVDRLQRRARRRGGVGGHPGARAGRDRPAQLQAQRDRPAVRPAAHDDARRAGGRPVEPVLRPDGPGGGARRVRLRLHDDLLQHRGRPGAGDHRRRGAGATAGRGHRLPVVHRTHRAARRCAAARRHPDRLPGAERALG